METMSDFFSRFKKEKTDEFLAIDIGTEAVKAVVFKKNPGGGYKIEISASSVVYFDKFGVISSEIEIIKKAISKAIEEIKRKYKLKTKSVVLSLPANIIRGRVASQVFCRNDSSGKIDLKEEGIINREVLEEAKKKISREIAGKDDFSAEEIQFLDFKIIEKKIDGYEISSLAGLEGSKIDFKILFTFLPKKYLSWVEEINKSFSFKNTKIINESRGVFYIVGGAERSAIEITKKGMSNFSGDEVVRNFDKKIIDAILLDMGGEITQIFLIKEGKLEKIEELTVGVRSFSKTLSNILGITEEKAKFLKEGYSKKELSEGTSKQIKEILEPAIEEWVTNLRDKLKDWQVLLPSTFLIFGGGSLLPDIKEIFEKPDLWQEVSISGNPKIELILPDFFKKISFYDKKINNSQFTPICFLIYE